ncbi:MAG: hypothetical protein U9P44_01920 [archaeon]|nr:hypothetical protein [archaeon]
MFRKNNRIKSHTKAGETVNAPGGRGIPFPLAQISGEKKIKEQRGEIDKIYSMLHNTGFNSEQHDPDYIEMTRKGIKFTMDRKEKTEELFSTGIKNKKAAVLTMFLSLGIYGILTPQYTRWNGLISELYYEIILDGTEEEEIFTSGLDAKLEKEYGFK